MINKLRLDGGIEAHLGLGKTGGGILPIGHIPELVDIVGTNVLVLQVVSVLPNINANDWNQTSSGLLESQTLIG